jgi:hypothetical protein
MWTKSVTISSIGSKHDLTAPMKVRLVLSFYPIFHVIYLCHTRALRNKAGCISYMRQRRQHI